MAKTNPIDTYLGSGDSLARLRNPRRPDCCACGAELADLLPDYMAAACKVMKPEGRGSGDPRGKRRSGRQAAPGSAEPAGRLRTLGRDPRDIKVKVSVPNIARPPRRRPTAT